MRADALQLADGAAGFPVAGSKPAAAVGQVPQWSRIGRLKRSAFPNLGSGGGHSFGGGAGPGLLAALAGRLICDTYLGARELLHEVDYTMATLARIHLGQTRSDLSAADVPGELLTPTPVGVCRECLMSGRWIHRPMRCSYRGGQLVDNPHCNRI